MEFFTTFTFTPYFYLLPFSWKADPNLYAEGRRSSRVAPEACRLSPNTVQIDNNLRTYL